MLLLSGKPVEACERFSESLKDVQKLSGKAHPHQAIANTYNYMGIAAYEANMLPESLRYLRRWL